MFNCTIVLLNKIKYWRCRFYMHIRTIKFSTAKCSGCEMSKYHDNMIEQNNRVCTVIIVSSINILFKVLKDLSKIFR